ncbi:hypothetical protein OUZ56_011696 [Daphnia magna]|uniref:Uncharacterized protein n=1 Tax=Daphnia magna TaxID=35525 RepID=A0ABQ9Z0W2_9CRUS|nr:hypothetical protein OUZ56_011696 [Daphnia magna]
MAFKRYGKPPAFDLDEYKDSFELWHKKWQIFLGLLTIDTALDEDARGVYKAYTLLRPFHGPQRRSARRSLHLIGHLHSLYNAGCNHHVWCQQFSAKKQGAQQAADDWSCELRDLSRKCEFETDCWARCEPTCILGQLIFGVESDKVRVKLLEQGDTLTLDEALAILRTAEASNKQSKN